ncbi:MAG: hypothetical protein JWQ09_537 [Segetibacter sp.]|nr:hypothetical protein [Segetibacter sp.]
MQEEYTHEQVEFYCSLIREIVDKTEWVIEKGITYHGENTLELAALLSLRQMMDYGDGICTLISQCSNDSAIPVIRTLFEVSIGLEYLLQDDYAKRASKLLFFYYKMQEIELLKRKAGTDENIKLIASLRNDANVAPETIDGITSETDIDDKILLVQQTLNSPAYSEVAAYYNSVTKNKKKHWYSLLDGPLSFKDLVNSVGMGSRYEVSYEIWSGHAHGWDIINRNLFFENGRVKIRAKRNPIGTYLNVLETIMIFRRALMWYVSKHLLQEATSFVAWSKDYNNRLETQFFQE